MFNGLKRGRKKRNGILLLAIILLVVGFLWKTSVVYVQASEKPVVKVGFFPMPGFHEKDKNGNYAGYDVEELNLLNVYMGKQIQYVEISSLRQAIRMLIDGQVDVLGGIAKKKAFSSHLIYSNFSAGNTYGAAVAREDNTAICFDDFKKFSTLTAGYVFDDAFKNDFLIYISKNNGQSPKMVEYANQQCLQAALDDGSIDIAIGNIMDFENVNIVSRFQPEAFYFITTKDKQPLMNEFDDAMEQLMLDQPDYQQDLRNKYYRYMETVIYTAQEKEYMKNLPEITIACEKSQEPISQKNEEGQWSGISIDMIDWISQDTGVAMNIVELPPGYDPAAFLRDGKADVVSGVLYSETNRQLTGYVLSQPYLSGSVTLIGRQYDKFIPNSKFCIAVPYGLDAYVQELKEQFPLCTIHYVEDERDGCKQVLLKQADVSLHTTDMADIILTQNEYIGLTKVLISDIEGKYSFLLKDNGDRELLQILNKAIRKMPEDVRKNSMVYNASSTAYTPSLFDFLRDYKSQITLVAGIFIMILFFSVMMSLERKRRYELIEGSEQQLRSIAENVNGGVLILETDASMHIEYVNDGFVSLIGYSRAEYEADSSLHDFHGLRKEYEKMVAEGRKRLVVEYNLKKKDGSILPILIRGVLSHNETGKEIMYCVMLDITEEQLMIQKLREEEERSRLLIEYSDSIFFDWSREKNRIRGSQKFKDIFGWTIRENVIPEDCLREIVCPEDETGLSEILSEREIRKQDLRFRRADGQYIWCRLTLGDIYDKTGQRDYLIGKIEDIDADVRKRENLEEASSRDVLTKLYNKSAFKNKVDQFIRSEEESTAVLYFIDLDNFKGINDTHGHSTGDKVLKDVARTLKKVFRKQDVVGRFGGDEFYAFVGGLSAEDTAKKAEEVLEKLNTSYSDKNGSIMVRASVGASLYPVHGKNFEELLLKADVAAYASKRQGKNRFTIYSDELQK